MKYFISSLELYFLYTTAMSALMVINLPVFFDLPPPKLSDYLAR